MHVTDQAAATTTTITTSRISVCLDYQSEQTPSGSIETPAVHLYAAKELQKPFQFESSLGAFLSI
jgi:hypothetical protein